MNAEKLLEVLAQIVDDNHRDCYMRRKGSTDMAERMFLNGQMYHQKSVALFLSDHGYNKPRPNIAPLA